MTSKQRLHEFLRACVQQRMHVMKAGYSEDYPINVCIAADVVNAITEELGLAGSDTETRNSLPGDGTRRAAFNAWWWEIWEKGGAQSLPESDEQVRSWLLAAWQAGAAHERDRICATRVMEMEPRATGYSGPDHLDGNGRPPPEPEWM